MSKQRQKVTKEVLFLLKYQPEMMASKLTKYQTDKLQGQLVDIKRKENSVWRYGLLEFAKLTNGT